MRSNADENRTEWVYWRGDQFWGFSFPSLSLLSLFPLFQQQVQPCGLKKAGTP